MASFSLQCIFLAGIGIGLLLLPGTSSVMERRIQVAQVSVTLHMVNVLKPPYMDMTQDVTQYWPTVLLDFMQQAANNDPRWRFTATYFNYELGFYLDAYNNVYGNYSQDKSFWKILGSDMKPIPLGISNYVPKDGETITFNLTRGS